MPSHNFQINLRGIIDLLSNHLYSTPHTFLRELLQNPYIKRVTNGVPDFANQGVRMTKDIWMSMPAGLSLGSQGALSILTNFAHVGDCTGGPPA